MLGRLKNGLSNVIGKRLKSILVYPAIVPKTDSAIVSKIDSSIVSKIDFC